MHNMHTSSLVHSNDTKYLNKSYRALRASVLLENGPALIKNIRARNSCACPWHLTNCWCSSVIRIFIFLVLSYYLFISRRKIHIILHWCLLSLSRHQIFSSSPSNSELITNSVNNIYFRGWRQWLVMWDPMFAWCFWVFLCKLLANAISPSRDLA